jgi:protein gp37
MGDWLDKEIPIEWFADLLKLIHYTPNLDWLLLTKRPGNWFERIRKARNWLTTGGDADVAVWLHDWLPNPAVEGGQRRNQQATRSRWSKPGIPPRNVWIGTSVEDQQRADERIPELLKIPARVRFLSVEPMLGPIDFPRAAPCGYYCDHDEFGGGHRPGHGLSGIHWVIFGGESGPKARPCNAEWIRDGVRQCRSAGVAPFVKQLGADPRINMSHEMLASDLDRMNQAIAAAGGSVMTQDEWDRHRCNVPLTLRCRKGGEMSKWPEDLRIREFPTIPA